MDGVIVVDKPAGMTSHDVVDVVRKKLGERRVGHAGTLDPDATGVLVMGVGKATRLLAYAQMGPKRYIARARFGITTTSQDASGEVVKEVPAENLAETSVKEAIGAFVGKIDQVPPMVSAVKVGGERLYKKARRGEEVDRPTRQIVVHELEMIAFEPGVNPEATFEVLCSGGTYVRTLVHDIGAALGCGAHLAGLRRVESGAFSIDDAVPLEAIEPRAVLPIGAAVRALPVLEIDDEAADAVSHGRALDAVPDDLAEGACVALIAKGDLIAVYREKNGRLVPDRVIPR
jgi:tRNA pseudouridine55 synthase